MTNLGLLKYAEAGIHMMLFEKCDIIHRNGGLEADEAVKIEYGELQDDLKTVRDAISRIENGEQPETNVF
jgi:hypothetical protein